MSSEPIDATESGDTARERFLRLFSSQKARTAITIGPGLVWLTLLMLAPLIFLIAVSFTITSQETYQIIWKPTIENYVNLLSTGGDVFYESSFFQSVMISYFIAAMTTITTFAVTFPVAYLLARRSGQFFKIVLYFVLLPFFTVYIVRAYSWFLMFGSSGNINKFLLWTGIINEPSSMFFYGVFPIIVGLTHAYFPYMLLTLYASLDGVDFSLIEASRDLGAGRIESFRDVLIPIIMPGIISGTVFVFVPALGAFLTPEFLAQGKVLMIGQLIAARVNTMYAIGYGSAGSMFIIVSVVIAFALAFRYVGIKELGGA
ncbi:MAG: ABC transporter permease [Halobacteriales archaeon]